MKGRGFVSFLGKASVGTASPLAAHTQQLRRVGVLLNLREQDPGSCRGIFEAAGAAGPDGRRQFTGRLPMDRERQHSPARGRRLRSDRTSSWSLTVHTSARCANHPYCTDRVRAGRQHRATDVARQRRWGDRM